MLRRQPNNTTSMGAMDLEPGQPVFVKEVNGNIWRTATVDQPAAEPHSYWVRFPDNSILRRTRSMIKPWSSSSHFELQAEAFYITGHQVTLRSDHLALNKFLKQQHC